VSSAVKGSNHEFPARAQIHKLKSRASSRTELNARQYGG